MSNEYIITSNGNFIREDELYHYGVLGMKWGQHRVRRNEEKAKLSRQSAKEWDEMAKYAKQRGQASNAEKYKRYASEDRADSTKYANKARQIQAKHEKLAGGKAAYNYTKKQSTGKALVKSYLFGTYGAMKYNEARSKGADRGRAAIEGVLYGFGNNATSGVLSVVEPRMRK